MYYQTGLRQGYMIVLYLLILPKSVISFFQAEGEVEEVTDSFVPLTNEMERMVSHYKPRRICLR